MRSLLVVFAVAVSSLSASAEDRNFVSSSRLTLGTETNLSASIRTADLDGDHDLDVVVANGRHWPQQNYVLMNHGRVRFTEQRLLGTARCTTYATELADLDGDGDIDIAVGNDTSPNRIFLNDGSGHFESGGTFGKISSVRSLTLADLDGDSDVDILSTSRGMPNLIYLNAGDATFGPGKPFGTNNDSTIDVAVADVDLDGHVDLVLANRDRQQNFVLLNDGNADFSTRVPFGPPNSQTRAVIVADMNGDKKPDLVTGNIGQQNCVYLADGNGGFEAAVHFGSKVGRTYALAFADMDQDSDVDLVVGNVGQRNAVFFNQGDGKEFTASGFGEDSTSTYGLNVGDLNADGFIDIVVANSGAVNSAFMNVKAKTSIRSKPEPKSAVAPKPKMSVTQAKDGQPQPKKTSSATTAKATPAQPPRTTNWSPFLGPDGRGVADGFPTRSEWNADSEAGEVSGVSWKIRVPGLGHSSPVVHGDRVFLATAIATAGDAPLMVGAGGKPDAADDNGEQSWVVLCYDRLTGKELWRKTARKAAPLATRHSKATHANTSVAIQGDNVVAFFGSEGMHCYDLEGNLKWTRDLGVIDISKYGVGWGYASSPAIHGDTVVVICDDPKKPFLAAFKLSDGTDLWRVSREGICERSWSTALIHSTPERTQVVVNGWPWIVSYDIKSGAELWRIKGGGDNPVPTPFVAHGSIYITNAHGAQSPIYVVRPDATGDVTPSEDTGTSESIVWSIRRGGCYMSTPVVYGDYLYLGNSNGVIRCFNALTGKKVFEKRLGTGAGIIASLVAADGKIYCASENGSVYVLKAGAEFEILAENKMGDPCFATPAISQGVIYVRTTTHLVAIQ